MTNEEEAVWEKSKYNTIRDDTDKDSMTTKETISINLTLIAPPDNHLKTTHPTREDVLKCCRLITLNKMDGGTSFSNRKYSKMSPDMNQVVTVIQCKQSSLGTSKRVSWSVRLQRFRKEDEHLMPNRVSYKDAWGQDILEYPEVYWDDSNVSICFDQRRACYLTIPSHQNLVNTRTRVGRPEIPTILGRKIIRIKIAFNCNACVYLPGNEWQKDELQ